MLERFQHHLIMQGGVKTLWRQSWSFHRDGKYGLEGMVEDAIGNIPFDVICLDEIAPRKVRKLYGEGASRRRA